MQKAFLLILVVLMCLLLPPLGHSARSQEQAKSLQKAAASVRFVDRHPKHPKAASMLWDAALRYESAKRYSSSMRLYERVVQQYPRWQKSDQALFRLATLAVRTKHIAKAVRYYSRLCHDPLFRSSKRRHIAMLHLAKLLEQRQHYVKAASVYHRYALTYVQRPDVPLMLFQAGRLYEKAKADARALRVYQRFIARYKGNTRHIGRWVVAHGRIMKIYQRTRSGKLYPHMRRLLSVFPLTRAYTYERARLAPYAAEAAFLLAMEHYRDFLRTKISSPDSKEQAKQILRKIQEYDVAAKELSKVVPYRVPRWLLCAMFYIAKGKAEVAYSIQRAPIPQAIQAFGRQAWLSYKEAIDQKFVVPLLNDAANKYKAVLQAAKRLKLKGLCVRQAARQLRRVLRELKALKPSTKRANPKQGSTTSPPAP